MADYNMDNVKKNIQSKNSYSFDLRTYFDNLYKDVGGVEGLLKLRQAQPDYQNTQNRTKKVYNDISNGYIPYNENDVLQINKDKHEVPVRRLSNANPDKYSGLTYFGNIVGMNLDSDDMDYSRVLHHELSHVMDYNRKDKSKYNTNLNWNDRPQEFEAQLHAARALYGKPIINNKDAIEFKTWLDEHYYDYPNVFKHLPKAPSDQFNLFRTIVSNSSNRQNNQV